MREVHEELGCRIEVCSWLAAEADLGRGRVLRVALARLVAGEPVPVEHDAVAWVGADELTDVDWLDSDRPFLVEVAAALGS